MIENLDFEDLSIYISATPVNLNKSIDGLAVLVQEALGRTPIINELFVFYNKSRDKIKLLIWDGLGFIILYKRFEDGRLDFKRYQKPDGTLEMTNRLVRQMLVGTKMEHGKLKPWALFEGQFLV